MTFQIYSPLSSCPEICVEAPVLKGQISSADREDCQVQCTNNQWEDPLLSDVLRHPLAFVQDVLLTESSKCWHAMIQYLRENIQPRIRFC